ncbi:FAD-dependent oxidoreductase [Dyadobacter pollutisoli]|uniref:Flavin-dependent monooxygenase n=1 Tax=Dyadobacter pollutisoli TaxID=2910158 RepID=A0A9E8NCS4_9BACT|nr:NAD(P)/FAD-dependent oxidoreductase [Dyadobacter pollutisoli]WAC12622.1 NAD(P)/FAD-dependent oxidoreductase [Dyadobacter pollutisoli]
MNVIQNKKIAIVGGGPGGLTLARLLQMKGADVKVYERDLNKDVRVQGATLDLHEESGLNALQQAGLTEAFKANYRPGADKMRILDKKATILFDDDFTSAEEAYRPEIDRGPLRKILLESLQPGTVVWDSYLLTLEELDGSWVLKFQNGTEAVADLVIAADGANSKIRPFITPIQPFFAGLTVVEGAVYDSENAVPELHKLLNGGKIFAMGDEKSIIVASKGDGSMVFYTGSKTDEDWVATSGIDFNDKAQVIAWFGQEFAGWDVVWLDLFTNAESHFIPRPQYCMPLDQTWKPLPNLTMLGDAAHLMPPYAGEGVNMAMLDALELSICLTSDTFPDLHSAIAHYETEMRARAAEVGQLTLDQTASIHSANAISDMLEMFS